MKGFNECVADLFPKLDMKLLSQVQSIASDGVQVSFLLNEKELTHGVSKLSEAGYKRPRGSVFLREGEGEGLNIKQGVFHIREGGITLAVSRSVRKRTIFTVVSRLRLLAIVAYSLAIHSPFAHYSLTIHKLFTD